MTENTDGNMFLKIGDIKGDSMLNGHEEEINILSWNWGMERLGKKPTFNSLSVRKRMDSASTALMSACCKGDHHEVAELTMLNTESEEYVKITISNVEVLSVSPEAHDGDYRPSEIMHLGYNKVKVEYIPVKDKKRGPTKVMQWDIDKRVG